MTVSESIEQIEAVDFCQFGSFKLSLKKLGLTWIDGENLDSTAAISNGAGKSNFFKAIGWCLYGKMPSAGASDNVIRDGAKRAKVTISLSSGWEICRERHRGAPSLRLRKDGSPLKLPAKALQFKIDEILGLDWRSYLNVVYHAQSDTARFINPSASNAERQKILFRLIGATMLDGAADWIRVQISQVSKEVQKADLEGQTCLARRAEISLSSLQTQRREWDSARLHRLDKVRLALSALKQKIVAARKGGGDSSGIAREIEECKRQRAQAGLRDGRARDLRAERDGLESQRARKEAKARLGLRTSEERLLRLSEAEAGGLCPTCGNALRDGKASRDWAAERAEASLAAAQSRLSLEEVESLAEDIADRDAELDTNKGESAATFAAKLETLRARRKASKLAAASLTDMREREQRHREELEGIRTELNPFEGEIRRAKLRRKALKESADDAKKRLRMRRRKLARLEFWRKGFSAAGLPSYMLDAVMPSLTERANYYLGVLSDGDMSICFSTQKELASKAGEFRDQISITWEIEGRKNFEPSDGQWRKMAVATSLALIDLSERREASGLDLLILDEVLDGLDAVGRQRLVVVLQELRGRRGTILTVSHDPEISEVFDGTVFVKKQRGVSSVRLAS